MSLTQDLRWSLGRSIALQLQRQTDLLLCTINCFLQWDHLPNMAVGDLAFLLYSISMGIATGGGGTDLEKGYGVVRPWRPPIHTSPAVRKGPISSKWVTSQDPLLRKFGNCSLYSLNFRPNFSSQAPQIWKIFSSRAPKFGNFQFASPLFKGKYQFASPTLRKSWPHTPTYEKKLSAPPGYYCRGKRGKLGHLSFCGQRCFQLTLSGIYQYFIWN